MQRLSFNFWQDCSSIKLMRRNQTACAQWLYHFCNILLLLLLFFLDRRLYEYWALREYLLLSRLVLRYTSCNGLTAAVWVAEVTHVFLINLVSGLLWRYLCISLANTLCSLWRVNKIILHRLVRQIMIYVWSGWLTFTHHWECILSCHPKRRLWPVFSDCILST